MVVSAALLDKSAVVSAALAGALLIKVNTADCPGRTRARDPPLMAPWIVEPGQGLSA
jgi:hypothetical protein